MRDTCNRDRTKDKINKIKLKKTSFFWAVKNLRTLSLWITHVDRCPQQAWFSDVTSWAQAVDGAFLPGCYHNCCWVTAVTVPNMSAYLPSQSRHGDKTHFSMQRLPLPGSLETPVKSGPFISSRIVIWIEWRTYGIVMESNFLSYCYSKIWDLNISEFRCQHSGRTKMLRHK